MGQAEMLYRLFREHPLIATDSRVVAEGSLFFALRGDRFDGNEYAAAALAAGAALAVVDDPAKAVSERYFVVEDTLRALQELAAYHRRQLGIPIIAITGSNGKTTTKELAGRILSTKYRTAMTEGNLNNHIGVPLTLLRMGPDTQVGIVEMGASHRGEIALLCSVAQPDYGLITNIGQAHLEGFGGTEGVRKGKGELFDYLDGHGGTAVYSSDDETIREMVAEHRGMRAVPYSTGSLAPATTGGYITVCNYDTTIRTHLVGEYNLPNVAAALAIGKLFRVGMEDMAGAIESYIPENNRSQKIRTGANEVIMDAYNANPVSMQAALRSFFKQKDTLPKAVILGDMLELGIFSDAEHRIVIEMIGEAGIPEAFLVGKHFSTLLPPAGTEPVVRRNSRFHAFADVKSLNAYLEQKPLRNYAILVKGSHGIHLEKTLPLL